MILPTGFVNYTNYTVNLYLESDRQDINKKKRVIIDDAPVKTDLRVMPHHAGFL